MVEAGLFDQFPCESVYSMHNIPGIEVGALPSKMVRLWLLSIFLR